MITHHSHTFTEFKSTRLVVADIINLRNRAK